MTQEQYERVCAEIWEEQSGWALGGAMSLVGVDLVDERREGDRVSIEIRLCPEEWLEDKQRAKAVP